MNDQQNWEEMIERHLRDELSEAEKERLAELLDSNAEARHQFVRHVQWDTEVSEALREKPNSQLETDDSIGRLTRTTNETGKTRFLRLMLSVASVVIVALSAGLVYQVIQTDGQNVSDISPTNTQNTSDQFIAEITGLSGALIWTGDRGQIVSEINVGTKLAGGTVEGLAPDSWFELQFRDGSKVMISGTSLLTFADAGQKKLRLREGHLSATVEPQPAGKPMLIHTRSAVLQVLGTRFDVEASLASTVLNVSEGKVNFRRLSDGRAVDVPAQYQVSTDSDPELLPALTPASVHTWKSKLHLRPENYGKWQPGTNQSPASLKAIPLVPPGFPDVTLYLAGLSVDHSDGSPVVLLPGSEFVVKGRLSSAARIHFGIRVYYSNGEFAGMFRGDLFDKQPVATIDENRDFEQSFHLPDFTIDPAVRDRKDELAARPDNLILGGVWAFTHTENPSGLEIIEVQLKPSGAANPN